MANTWKIRIADSLRARPFSLVVKNNVGSAVYTTSSNNDEIVIPEAVSNTLAGLPSWSYTITDANGKGNTVATDKATTKILQRYPIGLSVANGDFVNHLIAISNAAARNMTHVHVVYHENDVLDDAALTALGATVFDHTVPTGSYAKGFDEVVRAAYLTSANLETRVTLDVGIHLTRSNTRLNNGTTRTMFYSASDLMMRPDGSTPVRRPSTSVVPNELIPSLATNNVINFANRLLLNFFKRYLPAINDGTISSVGLLSSLTAEMEVQSYLQGEDTTLEGVNTGDFNGTNVAQFKSMFPEHSGLTNDYISANYISNNDLGKDWSWFLNYQYNKFEADRIAYIKTQVTTLTRTKWYKKDRGSYVDLQSSTRRTFNSFSTIPQEIIRFKSNDDPTALGDSFKRYYLEHLTSLARMKGGSCVHEPSPASGNFDPAGPSYWDVLGVINFAKQFGVGITFITTNMAHVDAYLSASGLMSQTVPAYKDEFKTVSGHEELQRMPYNLSTIYTTQNTDNHRSTYESYLTSTGQTRADIPIKDDVTV